MPFDAATRSRLARILGMLGSDSENEVLAAARQATRIQRETGQTWDELLAVPGNPAPSLSPSYVPPIVRHPNPARREIFPDIICPMPAWGPNLVAYVAGLHWTESSARGRWLRTLYSDPTIRSLTWKPTYGAARVLVRLWREARQAA